LLFLLFLQEINSDERSWAAGILERGRRDQLKNSEAHIGSVVKNVELRK
jgi:hypothetical protein